MIEHIIYTILVVAYIFIGHKLATNSSRHKCRTIEYIQILLIWPILAIIVGLAILS